MIAARNFPITAMTAISYGPLRGYSMPISAFPGLFQPPFFAAFLSRSLLKSLFFNFGDV